MRNFMSYGNATTVVDLSNPGTTLIVGEDLDNTSSGNGANGVGKTTIMQAIVYACYGRAITDIQVDNLINNINKKNMEVTLDFQIDDMCYRIVRARKMKSGPSGNYIRFYQKAGDFDFDDEHDTSKGHHSRDTDVDIEKVIGMKFDLFSRIIVFSAMNEAFFKLPIRSHGTSKKANQTDFIEELFGLTEISDKAEALKKEQDATNKAIADLQVKLEYAEREHKRHNEQLTSTKRRVDGWDEKRLNDLEDLRAKLSKLESIDITREQALHAELAELNAKRNGIAAEVREYEQELRSAAKVIKKAQSEIEVLEESKCPYCEQAFHDNQHKVDECSQKITEAETRKAEAEQKWEVACQQFDAIEQELDRIEKEITVPNPKTLANAHRDIEIMREKIVELENGENPFVEPLQELEAIELEPIDYTEVNRLTQLLEHQKFLMKLLTKRDSFVRKALLNKNLPYLNGKLQENLLALGLSHKVEFTHELTAKITQFGRELDFGNLSNGQQARVNIALSFAFRDVLQAMHTPINICLLDEVLDVGLDAIGVQAAAKMIKRKARDEKLSLFIISHRDEIDSAFDRTMTVQLNKSFSYIVQDLVDEEDV